MASKTRIDTDISGDRTEELSQQALGPGFIAAAASVGLAWYYFFLKGDKARGLFVGLWPPTILAFSSYFNQRKITRRLDTISQPGTAIKRTLDSVIGND